MHVEDIASQRSVVFETRSYSMTEKTQFTEFMFMFPPGSAETLVRRGGIANHHLTAYSLGNISAKIVKIGWCALKL